eukprot:196217-Chlamydomonas_euryale.AAC.3
MLLVLQLLVCKERPAKARGCAGSAAEGQGRLPATRGLSPAGQQGHARNPEHAGMAEHARGGRHLLLQVRLGRRHDEAFPARGVPYVRVAWMADAGVPLAWIHQRASARATGTARGQAAGAEAGRHGEPAAAVPAVDAAAGARRPCGASRRACRAAGSGPHRDRRSA